MGIMHLSLTTSKIKNTNARFMNKVWKKHTQVKVNLDEETYKVWKLLMLDINSDGVDGTDEDNAKRWENEQFLKDKQNHLLHGCILFKRQTLFWDRKE